MTPEDDHVTRRLYLSDSGLLVFTAKVISACAMPDGRVKVTLDQSAFFPESGGQASDTGILAGRRVDALEDAGDVVWHTLIPAGPEDAGPAPGDVVSGEIDAGHRLDMMQQHTGQHILSRCLILAGCSPTRSVHFGQEDCTLDLDGGKPTQGELDRAQEEADRCVLENRPIHILRADRGEMDRLGVRWDPSSEREQFRVIDIEGFDRSACGGTHARSTGEVGPVLILGMESVRGKWRLHFVAGARALRTMRQGVRILDDLAREFTVGWPDLPAAVLSCREEAKRSAREEKRLLRERGEWRGERLFGDARRDAAGVRRIGAWLGPVQAEEIRAAGKRIQELGPAALLLGSAQGDRAAWIAAGSPGVADGAGWDAGRALRRWLDEIGGKGGGTAASAQGASRLPAGEEEACAWDAAVRRIVWEGAREVRAGAGEPGDACES